MQFVYPSLVWGFWLALIPVLIHLINLVRRRRIQWAAMEFLLQSHRKHRKWIWLTQLLLLLMRVGVIALVVVMVAQWTATRQWSSVFGGAPDHHYVLLDDSYSMSERSGEASAFEVANQVLTQIGRQAMERKTRQKMTVLRFSRAAGADHLGDGSEGIDSIADLSSETVGAKFDSLLEQRRRQMKVTPLSVGPRPALEILNQLLRQDRHETRIVHLLSDFRAKEWEHPVELQRLLQETEKQSDAIHLVRCARRSAPNLTIAELAPGDDTKAADVPFFVHVSVKNQGTSEATRVSVQVRTGCFEASGEAASEPGTAAANWADLPVLFFDRIPPGETVTRRVQVFFPDAGAQVVEATLGQDSVAADNQRWLALDLPKEEPALIIDGSPAQEHAYFLQAAFEPGRRVTSGVRPETHPVEFLRDCTPETLEHYRAIYLLDVPPLDERSVRNLEQYVRRGGGLAFFLGERTDVSFLNEHLVRGGEGLFPLPLERSDLLPSELVGNQADLLVTNHPMFRLFLGERNPFLRLVRIERYFRPPANWKPNPNSTVRVIATLRNQNPLVIERQFGQGCVVAFLTTLAPVWNNWARDPSFVVMVLRLQAHLAANAQRTPERLVGQTLELKLDSNRYRKDVVFVTPSSDPNRSVTYDVPAVPPKKSAAMTVATLGTSDEKGLRGNTLRAGIYEAWLAKLDGTFETRRYALNVDPQEGNLELATDPELREKLKPTTVTIRDATDYVTELRRQAGYNRSLYVLLVLVLLLAGEQTLGYFASYHPQW